MNGKQMGYSTWLFFGLSVIIVFVYLLANVNKCESVEFCATTIFFIIFIGSIVMMIVLFFLSPSPHVDNLKSIKFFFMQDFTLKKLIWIPAGLGGVFLASYVGVATQQPLISIFLSGMIMLFAFFHTRAIGIPIIIHGLYNGMVVYLRSGVSNDLISQIFANNPISVPNIGLTLGQYSGLTSEIIFQIFLVAVAEEMFKVFITTFGIVAMRGKFDAKGGVITWLSGSMSVGVWTIYHSISAIK